MFGLFLALALGGVLYAVVSLWGGKLKTDLLIALLAGYALRLLLQVFVRELPIFSHGLGGDNFGYEAWAQMIVRLWQATGVHYVLDDELPEFESHTTFPSNLFALIFYLNGDTTRLGATAAVALAACLACFNVYSLGVELGADERFSYRIMLVQLFGPGFLFYTSDLFKDAFVAAFAMGALCAGFRLSQKFSVVQLVVGLLCLLGLWHCRYYLVFVAAAPVIVGVIGLRSKSPSRPLLAALGLGVVMLAVLAYSNVLATATDTISRTYNAATSHGAIEGNAQGGSGVTFDDGGKATGALHWKLLYTLFAPFPWQGGSIAFQVGKIDAAVWYVLAYWAYRAGRELWKTRPGVLQMFLVFIVPSTVMYALTMANVGLVLRQRFPILMAASVLAMLTRMRKDAKVNATELPARKARPGKLRPARVRIRQIPTRERASSSS